MTLHCDTLHLFHIKLFSDRPGVIWVSHQVSIISVNTKYTHEEDQLSVPTFLQFPSDWCNLSCGGWYQDIYGINYILVPWVGGVPVDTYQVRIIKISRNDLR